MAGPTTEYLAEQIDKIRDGMDEIRRSGIDESRRLGDIFADQIQDVRENMVRELTLLRNEVGAGREALKVEQSLIREDLAGLKAQTTALVERFDRTQDFLKQMLFWLVGSVVTFGGGLFWKASQAVHQIDEHGRRIESIAKDAKENQVLFRASFDKLNENQVRLGASLDRANEHQIRLRDSVDQLRKTLDKRLPAAVATP